MKIASISNLLARSFIVFVLAYLWLSFYISSIVAVFAVSFCIMIAVNYGFVLLSRRRGARAALTRRQQEHLRQVMLQLKFMSRKDARELFKRAFEILDKQVFSFYPLFNTDVTTADIIKCIKYTRKDRVTVIAAERFSTEVTAFAKALEKKVVLLDAKAAYEQILLPAEVFPAVTVEFKARRKLTWEVLRTNMFARARVRPYIIIGAVILATSFIVRFNIYYIAVATVVFSFALVSMFAVQSKGEYF